MIEEKEEYSVGDFDKIHNIIFKVKNEFQKQINKAMKKMGITGLQSKFLFCICKSKNGITLKELTFMIDVDKALTTRLVSELREMGLVEDNRNEGNSRGYKIFITPKGKKITLKSKQIMDKLHNSIIPDFNDEEKLVLGNILEKIFDKLKGINND